MWCYDWTVIYGFLFLSLLIGYGLGGITIIWLIRRYSKKDKGE
jgi:uncharacterized membrane protein